MASEGQFVVSPDKNEAGEPKFCWAVGLMHKSSSILHRRFAQLALQLLAEGRLQPANIAVAHRR